MTDRAADVRALFLFEQLADYPDERAVLLARETPAVLTALAALEDAAPRARVAFATEEDTPRRRRLLPLPDRVGAYRLGAKLGEGGMGLVFAADRDDGLFEHRVAIKLIHPDRFSERALERFAHERRLLARLHHPGIARLIDGGVAADGWPYIIMEQVDGVALDAHAAVLATVASRVALVEQVCDAVAAAHAAMVAHGDLKPGNVLVDAKGRTRLLDFGVARLIDDQTPATVQPLTVAFASPAMRAGEAAGVADDVYALGVLLRAVASAGMRDAHLRAPADRDLAAIVDKATADDSALRYRSVNDLTGDLARWQLGRPVQARAATARYLLTRFIARHRRWIAIGFSLAIALTLLSGLAIIGWRTAQQRSALAQQRTGDLRRLASYQLLVLIGRLEHQPRATILRRDLAREADAALAGALATRDATSALRQDAAEGYRLLARVEGAPDRPSLGHPERATAALARAEALLVGDSTRTGRQTLARVLLDRAAIAGADNDTEGALARLDRAQTLAVGASAALGDDIALLRADTLIWNGDFAEALALAGTVAARHAGAPPSAEDALRHDRIRDRQAEASFYAGDERGAAALYAGTIAALAQARRRWPEDVALDWALARQRWNLGTTLISLGQPRDALPLLRLASATIERIAAEDPDDMVAARRLRSYQMATAQGLAATGRVEEATEMLEANIAARRRWAAASPANTARQRDLGVALAALGDIHAAVGQRAAACARYADVHRLHARLARQHRLSRLDAGYFGGLIEASERKLGCRAD